MPMWRNGAAVFYGKMMFCVKSPQHHNIASITVRIHIQTNQSEVLYYANNRIIASSFWWDAKRQTTKSFCRVTSLKFHFWARQSSHYSDSLCLSSSMLAWASLNIWQNLAMIRFEQIRYRHTCEKILATRPKQTAMGSYTRAWIDTDNGPLQLSAV